MYNNLESMHFVWVFGGGGGGGGGAASPFQLWNSACTTILLWLNTSFYTIINT